jgi:hypothetical protein
MQTPKFKIKSSLAVENVAAPRQHGHSLATDLVEISDQDFCSILDVNVIIIIIFYLILFVRTMPLDVEHV